MDNARLRYLAYRRAPSKAVVHREERTDGTTLTLECGHKGEMAPHFSAAATHDWQCFECGKILVRNAPEYAAEF